MITAVPRSAAEVDEGGGAWRILTDLTTTKIDFFSINVNIQTNKF